MNKIGSILEGLHINEGSKFKFRLNYGCELKVNLGNLKAGTKFYCMDIINNRVKFVLQDDRTYEIILPLSFAENIFTNVGGVDNNKVGTLKTDFPYMPVEYCLSFSWSDKFIKKYTKKYKGEDYIYFPKGTKFKYLGADKSGDEFMVDGEYVGISEYGDDKEISDYFNFD